MRRYAAWIGVCFFSAGPVAAKPLPPLPSSVPAAPARAPTSPSPPPRPVLPGLLMHPGSLLPNARPAPPLPMLPSVARVRVETGHDRLVVFEEVSLPRGGWQSGALDLFVAFGSPGTPVALDARLFATRSSGEGVAIEGLGDSVGVELAPRVPPSANLLLGNGKMAGAILHLPEAELRRAFLPGGAAVLRVRTLLASPISDSAGAHDVVVRLGAPQGAPLTLGVIEVASIDRDRPIARVDARLSGRDADTRPLAVEGGPRGALAPSSDAAPIEPSQAVRHAGDDLCIRWWTK